MSELHLRNVRYVHIRDVHISGVCSNYINKKSKMISLAFKLKNVSILCFAYFSALFCQIRPGSFPVRA